MIPSIEYAKKHFVEHGFAPYSTVYVATNEDLRNALTCMPTNTERALTVAASGDHPMFTKLYGAKYIDTFDISFNTKLIMDIKTNALPLLEYKEYCTLLKNLYTTTDVAHVQNMQKIMKKLTHFEQQYLKEMRGHCLFDKKIDCLSLPTSTEYQQMRQIIKKPFNFIWSDIQTLHQKLKRKYDFMHLSNIFDYVGTYQNCVDILYSLSPYTVPGCNICITCFEKDVDAICEKFVWEQKLHHNNEQDWIVNNVAMLPNTCVMQRTR